MGEALDARYWCHMCSQMVNPIMEVEIKCPFCESGFVEEMDGREDSDAASDLGSNRALSLWAPILLEIMGGPSRRRRRFRREEEDEESDQDPVRESESMVRRRRSSAALLQLLQSLRAEIGSESDNSESQRERDWDREGERESERVILINPFNQAIILQGSFDMNQSQNSDVDAPSGASLGDYFVGRGLDLVLQYLAENDPNRYGTPPAQKEAVEAMPNVRIAENLRCSVCLEDFDFGTEAKEMPCKHKFHSGCILPWLELHSSCPICRFQMPADGSKDSNASGNGSRVESGGGAAAAAGDGGSVGNGRRSWIPSTWPFSEIFSLSGSEGGGNSSSTSSSSSASGSNSHEDEN